MLGVQHLRHHFTGFGAVVFRTEHALLLLLCDPLNPRTQILYDNKVVIHLCLLILGILSVGGGEVLLTCPHRLLRQHPMPPWIPSVHALLEPLPYRVGCCDMSSLLQYHRQEDNEQLGVPLSVPHPTQFLVQVPDKASTNLTTQRIIATVSYDCEVTRPPLTYPVTCDTLIEVVAIVRIHPLPI